MAKKKEATTREVKAFKVGNAWDRLSTKEQKLLDKRCNDYLDFISACKTERATLEHIKTRAEKAGFKELQKWQGKTEFRTRTGSR